MPFGKSKNTRTAVFITITLFLVIGCGKGNLYNFSDRMISTQYHLTAKPQVYTKNGEIVDQKIVERYLETDTTHTFFKQTDTTILLPSDTITFRSHDSAVFKLPGGRGTRVVKQQGQYVYFYMTDTAIAYRTAIQSSELKDIVNQIGIYKPYYGARCPAPVVGYCYLQEIYDALIAHGDSKRLVFPMFTYRITRKTTYTESAYTLKNYNNVFDKTILGLLQEGDTLVLQTAERVYEK